MEIESNQNRVDRARYGDRVECLEKDCSDQATYFAENGIEQVVLCGDHASVAEEYDYDVRMLRAHGHYVKDIEYGERIIESPLTDAKYRVTRWVEKGDGKIDALKKEKIDDD